MEIKKRFCVSLLVVLSACGQHVLEQNGDKPNQPNQQSVDCESLKEQLLSRASWRPTELAKAIVEKRSNAFKVAECLDKSLQLQCDRQVCRLKEREDL
jgi:hypothetical protein